MSATEWNEVPKKGARVKVHHHYSEDAVYRLERRLNCQNLGSTLRSPRFEEEWKSGWEFVMVRKKGDSPFATDTVVLPAEMIIPESNPESETVASYEFKLMPVIDNRWGDLVILRRIRQPVV